MNKNTFANILMFLTPLAALAAFLSVSRAIRIPESSTWIVPMVWVSIFIILIFSLAIFARARMLAEIVVAISLLTSMFFAFSWAHLAISIFCIFMVLNGTHAIRKDLDLNVKIALWKSLYMGKFSIIFALAFLISSQYFFTVKVMEGPVNVPKLDFSNVSGKLVGPMLGIISPEFAQASNKNLTVDEFIMQSQSEDGEVFGDDSLEQQLIDANLPANISEQQRELLKNQAKAQMSNARSKLLQNNQELVLQEGRKQFAKISGKNIRGDEKISVVFSGMINDRINNYFQPSVNGNEKSPLFTVILSLILFLTIWPLGSMVSIVWFLVIILIFKSLVHFGLVEVRKIMVEREMIG